MDVFDLVATLSLDSSQYESGLKGAEGFASSFGNTLKNVIGVQMVEKGISAVGDFAKSSIEAGKDFDSSMSQVAATMGKTVDEIGDLRDFAQEMGSTTAFSATQAADALNYMALAGYDADTSMQMLPNVLNLAAAGGIDLASASDMVTDAQSALGLTLDETSEMVDQMAKASSRSNTSVSQLGEAFLTIGATARNVKGGTQELSTVLGVLADNGIKGSEGGTKLRNIIMSLQNPTDDGAEALKALGVSVYDADGNMRSMVDIMGDLQSGLGNMDQASRDAMLGGIFNKADMAAANALIGTSRERFDELTAAIGDADGAAEAMANTQLDNLEGDITLFKSALEGAQIAISDRLTPTLRDFVQMGSEGLSEVTKAFKEEGLGGAMDALGTWLSDAITMIVGKIPAIISAGTKLLMALLKGFVDNLPKIAEAAVQAIVELAKGISSALPELIPAIVQAVMTMRMVLIENLPMIIDAAVELITGLANGLVDSIPIIIENVPKIISALVNAIVKSVPKIAKAGVELLSAIVKSIDEIIYSIGRGMEQILKSIIDGVTNFIPNMIEAGKNLILGLRDGIVNWGKSVVDSVKNVGGMIVDGVTGFFGINSPSKVFAEFGKNLDQGMAKGLIDNMGLVEDAIDDLDDAIYDGVDDGGFYDDNLVTTTTTTSSGDDGGVYAPAMEEPQDITIILELDGMQVGRAVYPYVNRESKRIGVRLAAGGIA